jgi:arabinose-5-phosphate isomerase
MQNNYIALGKAVIEAEILAIQALPDRLDQQFTQACEAILACKGRVIVMGMGKSGHIGNKIAATLASTGTPAFSVHPAEASHGDLGMITHDDVLIALSHSGNSDEILNILPMIKRLAIPLIAFTGHINSALALAADYHLNIAVEKEACPLNLAPTSSTTTTLVMGDALAIALLRTRGFTEADFARSHPAGRLGKRLLVHVSDLMHTDSAIPKVQANLSLVDAILEMTGKSLGMTAIVDQDEYLLGIFTDGDLRRAFERGIDLKQALIGEVMIQTVNTIHPEALAVDALNQMETAAITVLPILDKRRLVGILHMHDLLKAGIA